MSVEIFFKISLKDDARCKYLRQPCGIYSDKLATHSRSKVHFREPCFDASYNASSARRASSPLLHTRSSLSSPSSATTGAPTLSLLRRNMCVVHTETIKSTAIITAARSACATTICTWRRVGFRHAVGKRTYLRGSTSLKQLPLPAAAARLPKTCSRRCRCIAPAHAPRNSRKKVMP